MVISKITLERAEQWLNWDPNETTADYLRGLLNLIDEADSEESLSMLFPPNSGRIGFGTAGLRAAMDIGPLRMNDLVIVQTAQGLVKYCQAQDDKRLRIVIGYDHRSNTDLGLSSLSFAILTALVVKQSGMECILLDGFVPTPLVAFATQKLGAAAGIMVTASHNPKQDNGYKVYWSDGCQIRPPLDKEISASILENLTPWTDYRDLFAGLPRSDPSRGLSDPIMTKSLRAQYFDAIRRSGLVSGVIPVPKPTPAFCYSAMHGVGHPFAEEAFRIFGLPPFLSVPEQEQPDPMFPTVSFPNPEEKDALKLAKAFSDQHGCDVILANDPDADRLAVAERDQKTREWIIFTGDQIGALLGSWLWEIIGKTSDKAIAMCASVVSSRLLSEMARVEGFHFEDTLTGFKWIGSRAAALNRDKYRSIFCYEEAIGFCCGDVIFDKDGISALGVFAQLTHHIYTQEGSTLAARLQNIYNKYGEFVSYNGYYFVSDPSVVSKIIEDIRNNGNYMTSVGPYEVESIRDLGEPGYDSTKPDKKPVLPTSATSPMLTIRFKNGCVASFRGSGTEPKFKYYIELKGHPGVSRNTLEEEIKSMANIILETLLKPDQNGLTTMKQ